MKRRMKRRLQRREKGSHSTRGYINTFIDYTQKNLLCIHKRSPVHAQHSCACSGPGTPGARDPKKARSRARDWPSAFFGSLAPGVPGPEHGQECCACTRDLLCIHKRFFCVYTIDVFSYYHIIS